MLFKKLELNSQSVVRFGWLAARRHVGFPYTASVFIPRHCLYSTHNIMVIRMLTRIVFREYNTGKWLLPQIELLYCLR